MQSRNVIGSRGWAQRTPRAALLLCILLIGLPSASAQPGNTGAVTERAAAPTGIVGERVRQVIDLINAGDPAAIRAFAEAHFVGIAAQTPAPEHAADLV